MIPDVQLLGCSFIVSEHTKVSPRRHSFTNKRLVEYVARTLSSCAGIQAPVVRGALRSLVKHVQEQGHVQEHSEVGSTSQAEWVRCEIAGLRANVWSNSDLTNSQMYILTTSQPLLSLRVITSANLEYHYKETSWACLLFPRDVWCCENTTGSVS